MADTEQETPAGEDRLEKPVYKIKLKLLDRETGESREVTLDEAKTWDWENPEIWRILGGWQITSFNGLLAMMRLKAERGLTEIELLEADRHLMLAGG